MSDNSSNGARRENEVSLAGLVERCEVLGPGTRAVVWVQGCTLACPGCISTDTHSMTAGLRLSPYELADALMEIRGIEGVTISGGEPFQQAAGLACVLERIRSRSGLSVMCYSGFTRESLEKRSSAGTRLLLSLIDILVDGQFLEDQSAPLLWRGSRNQRVHFLTDRYAASQFELESTDPRLEVRIDVTGGLRLVGIPPAGFPHRLRGAMERQGVKVSA